MRLRVHHLGAHIDHRDGERVLVLDITSPDGGLSLELVGTDTDDLRRAARQLERLADAETINPNGEAA